MSALEILAVIGIIGYIIFQQVRGETLHSKRTVVLPAALTVIGFIDLRSRSGPVHTADVLAIALGCVGTGAIGLGFGALIRLESHDGYLWAQLPVRALWLWPALFAWRGVSYAIADGMHAHVAASSASLLFSLGINRLATAAVIVLRAKTLGAGFAPESGNSSPLSGLRNARASLGLRQQTGNATEPERREARTAPQVDPTTAYDQGFQRSRAEYPVQETSSSRDQRRRDRRAARGRR